VRPPPARQRAGGARPGGDGDAARRGRDRARRGAGGVRGPRLPARRPAGAAERAGRGARRRGAHRGARAPHGAGPLRRGDRWDPVHRSGRFHLRPRRRAQGGGDRSRRAPGLRRGRDYPRAVREVSSGGAAPPVVALGEAAWTVVLGDRVDRALHERVTALATAIGEAALPGVLEIVPAYATVTVFFDPAAADADALRDTLTRLATQRAVR